MPWILLEIRALRNFVLTLIWKNPWASLPWQQRYIICLLRATLLDSPLSPAQRQWTRVHSTTGAAVDDFCSRYKLSHTVKIVNTSGPSPDFSIPPARLHFVATLACSPSSSRTDTPTLYYLHGGGYSEPFLARVHGPLVLKCAAACGARQIVILEYGLAPEFQYPTQLVQAIAGLHHLLVTEGIRPSELVIGGDSAGGGLLASLLVHIVRPCPYAGGAAPLDLGGERFRGVFFLSPWVFLGADQSSFDANAQSDWIGRRGLEEAVEKWAPRVDEVWAAPCEAQAARAAWDVVFPTSSDSPVVAKVLVTAGMAEVLHDGIVVFGMEFVKAGATIVNRETDLADLGEAYRLLARCVDESHVQMGIDFILKDESGSGWSVIENWLQNL